MYCWSLAWRILSITLLTCEMRSLHENHLNGFLKHSLLGFNSQIFWLSGLRGGGAGRQELTFQKSLQVTWCCGPGATLSPVLPPLWAACSLDTSLSLPQPVSQTFLWLCPGHSKLCIRSSAAWSSSSSQVPKIPFQTKDCGAPVLIAAHLGDLWCSESRRFHSLFTPVSSVLSSCLWHVQPPANPLFWSAAFRHLFWVAPGLNSSRLWQICDPESQLMSPLFLPRAFSQTSVPCLRAATTEAVNWLLVRLVLQLWLPDKFRYFPRLITHTLTFLWEMVFQSCSFKPTAALEHSQDLHNISFVWSPPTWWQSLPLSWFLWVTKSLWSGTVEGFATFFLFHSGFLPLPPPSPSSNDLLLRPHISQRHCCRPACHHPHTHLSPRLCSLRSLPRHCWPFCYSGGKTAPVKIASLCWMHWPCCGQSC